MSAVPPDMTGLAHHSPLGETDGNHRVVCINRLHYDQTGRIVPVKMTFEGVPASSLAD